MKYYRIYIKKDGEKRFSMYDLFNRQVITKKIYCTLYDENALPELKEELKILGKNKPEIEYQIRTENNQVIFKVNEKKIISDIYPNINARMFGEKVLRNKDGTIVKTTYDAGYRIAQKLSVKETSTRTLWLNKYPLYKKLAKEINNDSLEEILHDDKKPLFIFFKKENVCYIIAPVVKQ